MPRVLLIGTAQPTLNELRRTLLRACHDVLTAAHGTDAAVVAQQFKPVVALIDLVAPVRDGIAALRHLQATSPDTACLIVSDVESCKTTIEAMRAGACDWLRKPVSEHDVLGAVTRVLSSRMRVQPIPFELSATEPHASTRLAEKAVLFIQSTDDKPNLREFGRAVGVSVGGLRNWCRIARIPARAFRQFARALRAVYRHERNPSTGVENLLDIIDRRTLEKFLVASGGASDQLPGTVDEFFRHQRFIGNSDMLRAVRTAFEAMPLPAVPDGNPSPGQDGQQARSDERRLAGPNPPSRATAVSRARTVPGPTRWAS